MPTARHIRALLRNRQLPTGDIRVNRMLSVVTVRSEKAHARIIRVRPPELPEGVTFVDSRALSGRAALRFGGNTMPILATDTVRYVGEPIGLLVGPDREKLLSLREDMRVIYEEFDPHFSLAEHSDMEPYQQLTKTVGDVDEAFASAHDIIERNTRTGVQEHFYPDPHAAYARLRQDGGLEVTCATQWPHHVRRTVAEATGIAQANIKVYAIEPGQSLEGKVWYPSLVASHAALASRASRAPCLLVYDRSEDLLVSPKRPATYLRYRAALDAEGQLLALDALIQYDTGAYPVMTEEMLRRLLVSALGQYTCGITRVHVAAYRTNSVPAAPTVAIDAPSWHAAELLVGAIIRKTHSDPVAWKLRHIITPESGNHVGERPPGDVPASALMEAATEASDFRRKFAAFELQRRNRDTILGNADPARGVGLAFGSQGTGFSGRGEESIPSMVRVELDEDGGAWLYNSCRSASAALQALWRGRIAESLGLDIDSVHLASCDTDTVPDSGPSMFSRAVGQQTRLIEQALAAVNGKRFKQPLPIIAGRSYRRPRSQPWD
ncbi:MAG: xanthine dehydrogenase family protein molybdopterin-binding subunit, partial [Spirochaetales bacterium]